MLSVAGSLGAMNVVLTVVCGVVAVVAADRAIRGQLPKAARLHNLGLMLFAGGWSLHRLYWSINRSLEAMGYDFLLTQLYKESSWITLYPMTVVVVGAGMLFAPILESLYGQFWLAKYSLTVLSLWLVLAVLL